MKMQSRRKMLLFHGVAEDKNEDPKLLVTKIITENLKISPFSITDIKSGHRMGRAASSVKPRPILIKYKQTTSRNSVWFAKTKLKNAGFTISEFLTKTRHNVFMSAREKFGKSAGPRRAIFMLWGLTISSIESRHWRSLVSLAMKQ